MLIKWTGLIKLCFQEFILFSLKKEFKYIRP